MLAASSVAPGVARAADLTVDGAKTYQTIDGLGVNVNVNSWKNGELRPALDQLVDVEGSSLLRVIRDPMDWVTSESQIAPLHALDAATLQAVYETAKMQDIWGTLAYLNQKGLRGRALMLNFMGWTPTWLGGSGAYGVASYITPGKEAAWATMVASLVYYARKVKNLDFTLLGPLNEEDWNCLEGPCVDFNQYTTCLAALAAELDTIGLSDIRVVGPDCAGAPTRYLPPMMANAKVAAKVDRLGLHAYGGSASPGTAYPGVSYWLTETAASCSNCDYAGAPAQGEWPFASQTNDAILDDLGNGLTGVLVYDGYDSFYYHHNSLGFWGLLSYASGVYTPRKRMYANAQLARFVRPGFVRVDENDSVASLGTVVAFRGGAGEVTIVGHNKGPAATVSAALLNMPPLSALSLYVTSATQDLARAPDVPVSAGQFMVQLPSDAFFTLTNVTAPAAGSDAGPGASPDAGTVGGDAGFVDGGTPPGNTPPDASARGGSSSGGCACRAARDDSPGSVLTLALIAFFARGPRRARQGR